MLAATPAHETHSEQPAAPDAGRGVSLPPPNAEVHHLENGLTVIVDADPSAPVASVQAWVGTGSIHEGRWLGAGLSHILEHMLFKGTETRGAGDIARQVQDLGGYINAYTTFDRTVYFINVPSPGAGAALEILLDAMVHSTLPVEEYEKEQEVIRREFAMGFDDPNRQGLQLMLRTLYPNSPYGIPVIGHLDIFNRLTREDVLEYYKARYVPNNMTVIVSGGVDAAAVLRQIREFFSGVPRGKLAPVFVPPEPPQIGRREQHEEFPTELSRLYMAWRVPALDSPDAPALEILAGIVGTGRSSVLNREIRERKNLAHSIGAGIYSTPEEGVFYVVAVCDPDKRQAVEAETLAAIAKIARDGVGEAELEKARRGMLSDLLSDLTTAEGRASSHGSNWTLTRNLEFGRQFLDAVSSVTAGDVARVAREYLREDRLTVASLNPAGSLAKTGAAAAGRKQVPVQKFVLPNGLTLLVREDPRLPLVNIAAAFRGGTLAESESNSGITRLLANTILKGTTNRSAEEIADAIEGAGGSISAAASSNAYLVAAEVMRPDLALGLELVAEALTSPTFPEREIETERASQIASIKAEEDQITAVARNLMRQTLFGEHPYALPPTGTAESVGAITRQDLLDFHAKHTVARNGVLAVFGDVKADEVLRLATGAFAGLPAGERALEDPPQPPVLEARKLARKEVDKEQAVVMVGYRGAAVTSPDRPALELIASASSDLGSRFFDRIREKMGLAYFVGAAQMNGLAPGVFAFYVGTDPAKVEKVTEALKAEIADLAENGLTPEELNRAKQKILGSEAMEQQSNAAFAAASAGDEIVGLGFDHFEKRKEEIESVTLEQVREVARKYFRDAHPVEITVLPPAEKVSRVRGAGASGAPAASG